MRLRVLALGLALAWPTLPARGEPALSFVGIEANEGDSSGGHAALRIGDEVFHFQYHPGRLLLLERDGWAHFRHVYGRLGNRRIHLQRIAATPGTAGLLRDAFATRLLEEAAEVRLRDALRLDRVLLDALAGDGTDPRAVLAIPGAGYFTPGEADTTPCCVSTEPVLEELRDRLLASEGAGALARRIDAERAAIRALRYEARPGDWLARAEGAPLSVARTFSERLVDGLARLRALEVLAGAIPLAPGSFHAPEESPFVLDAGERLALARQEAALGERALELLGSSSADAGRTLLVVLARLAALSRSVAGGHLVFLDVLPEEGPVVDAARVAARPEIVSALRAEAVAELRSARTGLVWREQPGEAERAALESAANRLQELLTAPREGRALRVRGGPLLPARAAPPAAGAPLPALDAATLASARERARSDERSFGARFASRHRYDLLTRNCATEIFRGIDQAFAAAGEDPVVASRARLGGYLDGGALFRFIPFVAGAAVAATWRIVDSQVLPSEREARIAAWEEHEPALAVALRESNTLTSSLYRLHGDDSFFLFFTDGPWPVRPVLGAVNLAAGLGQAVLGLASAPFDGGTRLAAGASGMLFSLPELVFVSLRKGTLDWVPPATSPGASDPDALATAVP